jgi:5-(carboxyamino)imidazole ribonucleotide synthase
VEYFVVDDGTGRDSLVVNEMAPRPHNSGHYTQNACSYSQFEAQVRALVGLPLPEPVQHSPATMVNLLGDLWWPQGDANAAPTTPPWDRLLALPGTHLHLYGKLSARPGRKMGHLNITGASVAQVRQTTEQVLALLGLPSMQALAS